MNKLPNYLSLKVKCDILDEINAGTRASLLAKKYNVARSTISNIKSKGGEILKCYNPMADMKGHRKRMRKTEHPKMEEALIEWMRDQEEAGNKISGNMLREQAVTLHEQLHENDKQFVASDGWIHRFKTRYKLLPSREELARRTGQGGKLMFFEEIKLKQSDDEVDNVNRLLALEEAPICYSKSSTAAATAVKQEHIEGTDQLNLDDCVDKKPTLYVGNGEAFDAISKVIVWAQNNHITVREINTLEKLRYIAEIKMNKS